MSNTIRFQNSPGRSNYTNRVFLANILGDGQAHSVTELANTLCTSPRGVRARISDLRTQNNLLIRQENGMVRLVGVRLD